MKQAVVSATLSLAVLIVFGSCSHNPVAPDSVALQQRIAGLLQLHGSEQIYRDVVYFGEQRSFLFFRTMDRRVLFAINIRVRAGIDFAEGVELIRHPLRNRRIEVRLPPARILVVDADETSIQQYFALERGGALQWLELADEIELIKTRVEADAVARGILQHAEGNAHRALQRVLQLTGFDEVKIVTRRRGAG